MFEAFTITLAALVAMQLSPGPNLIAVASTALGQGRQAAFAVAAGVACGAFIWVLTISVGLGALVTAYPVLVTVMKLSGGAYLLWLGLKGLLSAFKGSATNLSEETSSASEQMVLSSHVKRGLLVVMTNPKAALGWAAIASFMFGSGLSAWQVATFAPIAAASSVTIYGGYGFLFSTQSVARFYRRFWRVMDGLFGTAFGVLGAKLLWDGLKEAKL
ncbi:LysE family transporter [Pseudovibrio sp. Tun.PSC04-5.I4]|uniref:LysE family translocator n=1 Tax=Pseudovibrio sp. Tun.PSC04-5.I4 TaxID=1798213 RepID=UPI00088CC332|nr:LysE family transporter [Pseudovibrio sp. Tun.PSC04-5.I4]SDR16301.1 Threonine/homoserine/homoserine lactone efflux protein [Pseudovibrio sp. Tun.PSC04-5.I4]